jgi:hypothetical protein
MAVARAGQAAFSLGRGRVLVAGGGAYGWQVFGMPMQLSLTHWLLVLHGSPATSRHAPPPVQACVGSPAPPHTGLSSVPPTGMLEQVPSVPARAQDWQTPVHAELQQRLSTHWPPWQSMFSKHTAPNGFWQWVAPSQVFGAEQVSSVMPLITLPQVPEPHETQSVLHAVSQQMPSAGQKPLTHWPADAQPCPFTFLQTPLPSHAWAPEHAGTVSVPSFGIFMHVPTLPTRSHA